MEHREQHLPHYYLQCFHIAHLNTVLCSEMHVMVVAEARRNSEASRGEADIAPGHAL